MVETETLRIIDVSLNRAAEGLRVVEDYARFALDDAHLTKLAKQLRHGLAQASQSLSERDLNASRETQQDVGTTISTASEGERGDSWHVCAASLKRVEQSLRSLEEYGKLLNAEFAASLEQLRYRTYTLEKALCCTRASLQRLADARLYALIDGRESPEAFESLTGALVSARVDILQLRDKRLCDRELVARARQLVELTRNSPTLAIINDRPDIALAANADGVHLGQSELSVKDARTVLGTEKLIGVSTHNIDQARQAVLDGADYLGAGPTFPTKTKAFDAFPGLKYLRQVTAEISMPTFAIGGIDQQNLAQVCGTGVSRVAVCSALAEASDPKLAAEKLLQLLSSTTATTSSQALGG